MKFKITEIREHVLKAEAKEMYEIIEEYFNNLSIFILRVIYIDWGDMMEHSISLKDRSNLVIYGDHIFF